jgi:hypothetical protein
VVEQAEEVQLLVQQRCQDLLVVQVVDHLVMLLTLQQVEQVILLP